MALSPGTRLGPYEITAQIGAGGMGEVYRAIDTNLSRQVAIKVLPESMVADTERLARFDREAKTLAALNHPNIAAIYGLERSDGQTALVLELVEGVTLADRLAEGALPVDEALTVATQIAEALEAAHDQGIVHRDLKPANIKVREDGTVKVLDFGLAKLNDPQGAIAPSSNSFSPTITTPALMTGMGALLGTPAYMSPEQARGKQVDKRSDVWAFGCVLYEMVTGRRAFEGEEVSDTLASVLKTEPDWNAIPADLPAAVHTLIRRCLVKERRGRVADASVIQYVLAESASLSTKDAHDKTESRRISPAMSATLAALLTAGVAAATAWIVWPSSISPPVDRFTVSLPEGQQFSQAARSTVAISPDDRQVVYVANNGLYVRSLSEFSSRLIPGTETKDGLNSPVFSPDSAHVAYYSLQGLKRIPVDGGTPVTVCVLAQSPYGLTWDTTGLIAGQGRFGIVRCAADGGQPEQLVKVDEITETAHGPQLLPGGDALLYTVAKAEDGGDRWDNAQVVIESLSSHMRKPIIDGGSDARYLSTGHLIYAFGGDLFASRFDLAAQSIVGGRVAVLEGVRRAMNAVTGAAHVDVSDTGTLVFVPGPAGGTSSDRVIATASRTGGITPLPARAGPYVHVRATRDGARLALDSDDGREANIWLYEMDGKSDVSRLTFEGKNRLPIWSPDGQRVAFQSDREGDLAIWVQRIDGTGIERLTRPEAGEAHVPEAWSPDGTYIAFAARKEGSRPAPASATSFVLAPTFELRMLSLKDKSTAPFGGVRSIGEPIGAVFSPDGRWIAYHSRGQSDDERGIAGISSRDVGVFVQSFPAAGLKHQAPKLSIDFHQVWSRDGEELYYVPLAASGQVAAVRVIKTESGVRVGTPTNMPARVTANRASGLTRAFDVLPDGQFVGPISSAEREALGAAQSTEIRVVTNWFEELKRLAPSK